MLLSSAAPYRLTFAARGDLRIAARTVEALTLDPSELERFSPYEWSSLILAVTDATGEVAGMARLITPGPAGFKTLNDLPETDRAAVLLDLDPDRTWDLASFTVRPGAGSVVAAALCHGVVQALRRNHVRTLLATVDEPARRALALAGLRPARLPGLPGTRRVALWAPVSGLLDDQRRSDAEAYRLVTLGVGLDGVAVPSGDQLLLSAGPDAATAMPAVRHLVPTA